VTPPAPVAGESATRSHSFAVVSISARYVDTNLIAEDRRALAKFYPEVSGCQPVPPERDFQGGRRAPRTGIGDGAKVTWCFVTDPEGNVIELQRWSK